MSVERNPALLGKLWRFLGAKGTLYPLGSDGVERELAVGADGTILAADSAADGGMTWVDPEIIVAAASGDLANERVATDTANVEWDFATAGQAKADLTDTGVTAGTYGDATNIPQITVDAKGRITSVTEVAASGGGATALDDLTDVDASSPSDGDVLTYDAGSGDWVPTAPSGGGGGSSGTGSPEGVVTGGVGDFYIQTDASPASDGVWYKRTGSGNTGWEQVTASDGGGGSSDPLGYTRREAQYMSSPGQNAFITVGMGTVSGSGSTSVASDADGPWINYATSTSNGNTVGAVTGFNVLRRYWQPELVFVVKTAASLSNIGLWIGMMSSSIDNTASPSGVHVAAFRYYTSADGTAFWRTVTSDGSSTTVTDTTAAIATDTKYILRIVCGASDVKFYVDGTLVATHTTDLPTDSQNLGWGIRITTLTAAAANFKFSRMWLSLV